jgi:hypothetical protein
MNLEKSATTKVAIMLCWLGLVSGITCPGLGILLVSCSVLSFADRSTHSTMTCPSSVESHIESMNESRPKHAPGKFK